MLSPNQLYSYQREAIYFSLYHPDTMLWLGMGLGKTICALTAAVDRKRAGQIDKVLVVGPLRVIQSVWHTEARKWEHTNHLRFSFITGGVNKRRRALFANADIFLVNYENINWLAQELVHYFTGRGEPLPFQMAIYDEVTKMKNSTSVRMNGGWRDVYDSRTQKETPVYRYGWRHLIDQFSCRMGLTGTPASNGYLDLHGQFLVVDGGERLGPSKTSYKENYFTKSWNGWGDVVTPVGKSIIEARISDITLKMDTRDYRSDLPDVVVKDVYVDLPKKAMEEYRRMEKQMFSELDEGRVEVFSAGAAATKAKQIASGSVYASQRPDDEEEWDGVSLSKQEWYKVHDAKLTALEEVLEEANGAPVLVGYAFKPEAARIAEKFKSLKPVNLTETPATKTQKVIDDWNAGKIRLLIGHPASMGHGLDGLQQSGSIVVWFGLPWALDMYDQMNARIDRPGQTHPVSIIRILSRKTIDKAVVQAIESKATDEASLKQAIAGYREEDNKVSFL